MTKVFRMAVVLAKVMRVCAQIIQLPCVVAYSVLAVFETLVTKV